MVIRNKPTNILQIFSGFLRNSKVIFGSITGPDITRQRDLPASTGEEKCWLSTAQVRVNYDINSSPHKSTCLISSGHRC